MTGPGRQRTGLLIALIVALGCAKPPAPSRIEVIAHRGASAYAPENTLPAIARALARGARHVELDVQLASDGVPVLFHDATLDEKTAASGRVADHPSTELVRLDIGQWFDRTHPESIERFSGTRLATLDAAFAAFGALPLYHLELKSTDEALVASVLAVIRRHGLTERVRWTSFHVAQLEAARRLAPGIPRCILLDRHRLEAAEGEPRHRAGIDAAARRGAHSVAIAAAELTPNLVRHARAKGLSIRAWKVRTLEDWRRILEFEADGGTVDWPDRALRAVREAR